MKIWLSGFSKALAWLTTAHHYESFDVQYEYCSFLWCNPSTTAEKNSKYHLVRIGKAKLKISCHKHRPWCIKPFWCSYAWSLGFTVPLRILILILINVPCSNENTGFYTLVDLPDQDVLNVIRVLLALGRYELASSPLTAPTNAVSTRLTGNTNTISFDFLRELSSLMSRGTVPIKKPTQTIRETSLQHLWKCDSRQFTPYCHYYLTGPVGLLCCGITSLCITTTICPASPLGRRLRLSKSGFLRVNFRQEKPDRHVSLPTHIRMRCSAS